MEFTFTNPVKIPWYKTVKLKRMNNVIQVTYVSNPNNGFKDIKKLSKYAYMIKSTGEILDYNLSDNRGDNIASLKSTFCKLRDLINNNFIGGGNELHVTLTYSANMQDTKQLYSDFKAFWRKYKYKYGDHIDYLSVIEPQERGAWHIHLLIRHNNVDTIFISSNDMSKIWGNGFIKIKALKGVDNIGAYLSAYLSDVEVIDEKAVHKDIVVKNISDGSKKRIKKGGRIHLYPPGINLFRHSKGIKPPIVEEIEYREAKKIVGVATPDYSRTLLISSDYKIVNQVTYENYNTKRNHKYI